MRERERDEVKHSVNEFCHTCCEVYTAAIHHSPQLTVTAVRFLHAGLIFATSTIAAGTQADADSSLKMLVPGQAVMVGRTHHSTKNTGIIMNYCMHQIK